MTICSHSSLTDQWTAHYIVVKLDCRRDPTNAPESAAPTPVTSEDERLSPTGGDPMASSSHDTRPVPTIQAIQYLALEIGGEE